MLLSVKHHVEDTIYDTRPAILYRHWLNQSFYCCKSIVLVTIITPFIYLHFKNKLHETLKNYFSDFFSLTYASSSRWGPKIAFLTFDKCFGRYEILSSVKVADQCIWEYWYKSQRAFLHVLVVGTFDPIIKFRTKILYHIIIRKIGDNGKV